MNAKLRRVVISTLILLPLTLHANESTLPLGTSSPESTSPIHRDISVPLDEYIDSVRTVAATDNTVNWQFLLLPVSPLTEHELAAALAIMDSLRAAYDIAPDSINCERWPAWQLAICNLELATGKYSEAVGRHMSLNQDTTSCIDDQELWWILAEQHYYQLVIYNRYREVALLLEEAQLTFPAGPARQMRSQLARLKFRLGTLEWKETIEGTLGEARLGGIASHYRDLITTDRDTLTYLITSETVIVCNNEIWVPGAGFTPKQDFESEYRGGDSFADNNLYPGSNAVFYLDSSGEEVVLIEFEGSTIQE